MSKLPVKRAQITLEYYHEASLERMIDVLKNHLLNGDHDLDKTIQFSSKSLLLTIEQKYTENFQRERREDFINGHRVELVRSNV